MELFLFISSWFRKKSWVHFCGFCLFKLSLAFSSKDMFNVLFFFMITKSVCNLVAFFQKFKWITVSNEIHWGNNFYEYLKFLKYLTYDIIRGYGYTKKMTDEIFVPECYLISRNSNYPNLISFDLRRMELLQFYI